MAKEDPAAPQAKTPAAPATPATPEEAPPAKDIFAHFAAESGEAEAKDPNEALVARLDAMEKTNKGLQEQLAGSQRHLMSLMSTPVRPAATAEPKPPAPVQVSVEGLPDPITAPEAYAKALNERISGAITTGIEGRIEYAEASRQHKASSQAGHQERADALWEEFRETYPDLAEDETLVEVAVRRVSQRAQRRGVDLDTYMFRTSENFMADVAAETRKVQEKYKKADKPEPKPGEGQGAQDDPGRTGGIFGGVPASGGPAAPDAEGDMVKELQDVQRKTGFY